MAESPTNPAHSAPEADKETSTRPLTIWDNTSEVEQREIDAFMEWAWAELNASIPPYEWRDEPL